MTDLQRHLDNELLDGQSELDDGIVILGHHAMCTNVGCEREATTSVYVNGEHVPRCPEHDTTPFTIDGDGRANWALHKIRSARRRIDEVETLYEEELDRLNAFREHETRFERQTVAFFEHHLVRYGMQLRNTDPEGKERTNHALPAGTIRFRRSQSVKIDDLDAVIEWAAQSHEELIDRSVRVGELRALLQKDGKHLVPITEDGERVPGIRVEQKLNTNVETP